MDQEQANKIVREIRRAKAELEVLQEAHRQETGLDYKGIPSRLSKKEIKEIRSRIYGGSK